MKKHAAVRSRSSRFKSRTLRTLPIYGRAKEAVTGPGGCLHALAQHDEAKDVKGHVVTISYATACLVRHTKMHDGKKWVNAQPHKDGQGRTWEA